MVGVWAGNLSYQACLIASATGDVTRGRGAREPGAKVVWECAGLAKGCAGVSIAKVAAMTRLLITE